jgi:glutamate dehydrogenase
MPTQLPKRRLTLIDRIIKAAKDHADRMPLDLLRRYFSGVGEEDLAARDAVYLAGIASLHYGMADKRRVDQALLKIVHVSDSSSLVLIATDDRPFLVESLGIAFAEIGVAVRMLVHPVLHVRRDGRGRLLSTHDVAHEHTRAESWQLYEIDRLWDAESTARLESRLHAALEHVQLAVTDWIAMRAKVRRAIDQLAKTPLRGERAQQRDEAIALLDWMEGAHFVFLGYRYQRLMRGAHHDRLQADQRSGLGILRTGSLETVGTETLQGELRNAMRSADPLIITKSALRSTVHRSGHLDHLTVKDFDTQGRVRGEHRFLGLWTALKSSLDSASTLAVMTARPCWPYSRPGLGMSCSSPAHPNSSTSSVVSSTSMIAQPHASCCATTRSVGFGRAWLSSLAIVTRQKCVIASKRC